MTTNAAFPLIPVSEAFIPQWQLLKLVTPPDFHALTKKDLLENDADVMQELREVLEIPDDADVDEVLTSLKELYDFLVAKEDEFEPYLQNAFDEARILAIKQQHSSYNSCFWKYPGSPLNIKAEILDDGYRDQAQSKLCRLPTEIILSILKLLDEQLDEVVNAIRLDNRIAEDYEETEQDANTEQFDIAQIMILWDHGQRVGAGAAALSCKFLATLAMRVHVHQYPGLMSLLEWYPKLEKWCSTDIEDGHGEVRKYLHQRFCRACCKWRTIGAEDAYTTDVDLVTDWVSIAVMDVDGFVDDCISPWYEDMNTQVWSAKSRKLVDTPKESPIPAICPTCRAQFYWIQNVAEYELRRGQESNDHIEDYWMLRKQMQAADAILAPFLLR